MGVISRTLTRVRQIVDEPTSGSKYTDLQILDYITRSWEVCIVEANSVADNPITVRLDIALQQDVHTYLLPPNIGEFWRFAKVNTKNGLTQDEYWPASRWNPSGPGFTIEGNVLRVTPIWTTDGTFRIEYVPSGDSSLFTATSLTGAHGPLTITVPVTPDSGTIDKRPQAYLGAVMRTIGGGGDNAIAEHERVITSHTITPGGQQLLKWNGALDPYESGESLQFEMVPSLWFLLEMAVSFYTASLLLAIEGDDKRRKMVEREYHKLIRNVKLRGSNLENRVGDRFEHDTPENPHFLAWKPGHWR